MKQAFLCVLMVLASCVFTLGQTYKVLWSFGGYPSDGANPDGKLISDTAGNFYGTTRGGGAGECPFGCGTVFELSPQADGTWAETILYEFCLAGDSCPDGDQPEAGLAMDPAGNLYGTTYVGGNTQLEGGTVFELSPPQSPGGAWTFATIYDFCNVVADQICLDGMNPTSQLVFDTTGNLYGTTMAGGAGHIFYRYAGAGTVFELSPSANGWTETVLYNFCTLGQGMACPDGSIPGAGVSFDGAGNLYGTTEFGGGTKYAAGGTVYELSPAQGDWTEKVLAHFIRDPYFPSPISTVSIDPEGNLYGTTSTGGIGCGTVFSVTPKTGMLKQLVFDGSDGATPVAGVLLDIKRHVIYGTTDGYCSNTAGTVYKLVPPAQMSAIYSFCSQPNCADGGAPEAGLIEDKAGNLYGTTYVGGTSSEFGGNGVVFEITP